MSEFVDVKASVLRELGAFWLTVFMDNDFVLGHSDVLALNFSDFLKSVDRLPAYSSRKSVPIKEMQAQRLFYFNEEDLDTNALHYGDNAVYGVSHTYGEQEVNLSRYSYPIEDGFSPSFLTTAYSDSPVILRKGEDYTIAEGRIFFLVDISKLEGIIKRASISTNGAVVYTYLLWGFSVEQDIQAVCDFWGTIGGVCGESTSLIQEASNIAWDLRVEGATVRNITRAMSAATDTDYVSKGGVVRDVFYEGDRICVLLDDAVYTAPLSANVLVSVGDTIQEADVIFDTFSISPGQEPVPFSNFEGLSLDKGYLSDQKSNGILFVNTLVPVTKRKPHNWFTIKRI